MTMRGERGTSLIEVLVATALLATLMAGLMAMAGIAISTTENQGHLAARNTEYAQDKMEQLVALAYSDGVTDTRTFPAVASGGSGLAVGGSYNINSPVDKYVDYLDEDGNLCGPTTSTKCPTAPTGTTAPNGWFYKRCWKIDDSTTDGTLPTNIKKITVAATTVRGFGGAVQPTAYLAVLKTNPF
jgi:type II secretory pathway pseudopilin PulG